MGEALVDLTGGCCEKISFTSGKYAEHVITVNTGAHPPGVDICILKPHPPGEHAVPAGIRYIYISLLPRGETKVPGGK